MSPFPRNIRLLAVLTLVMSIAVVSCTDRAQKIRKELIRTVHRGILHQGVETKAEPVTPSPQEQQKKEVAERLDTEGLLYSGKVVVDKDPRMLEPPETVAKFAGKDYVIAKEPPEIEFVVIPAVPLFLGKSPVDLLPCR